jgi:hypothetical protein
MKKQGVVLLNTKICVKFWNQNSVPGLILLLFCHMCIEKMSVSDAILCRNTNHLAVPLFELLCASTSTAVPPPYALCHSMYRRTGTETTSCRLSNQTFFHCATSQNTGHTNFHLLKVHLVAKIIFSKNIKNCATDHG